MEKILDIKIMQEEVFPKKAGSFEENKYFPPLKMKKFTWPKG